MSVLERPCYYVRAKMSIFVDGPSRQPRTRPLLEREKCCVFSSLRWIARLLLLIFMILGQPCLDPKSFTQSSLELVGSLSSAFDMLEESTEHKQDGASDASQTDCGSSLLSKGAQLFSLKSHVPTAWIWHLICLYPQRDEGKS